MKPAEPHHLQILTKTERFIFRVMHRLNWSHGTRALLGRVGASFGKSWVEFVISDTVQDHGFENFKKIDPTRGLLLVANHRSFYDQFAIAARLFTLYGNHHNIYFPVRSNFFYDSMPGLFMNVTVATAMMYPPVLRDAKRKSWNRYATDIMAELLKRPQNMVGFHPEGTRSRGPDPYEFLSPKPGCGELIFRANPNVVPVFLQGFPRSLFKLRRGDARHGQRRPLVHMVMGPPIDFSGKLAGEGDRKLFLSLSQTVMTAIAALAEQEQEIRAQQVGPE